MPPSLPCPSGLCDRGAWAVGGLVAGFLGLLVFAGFPATLDRAWFDFLSRRHASPAAAPADAVMVLVDEAAVAAASATGERWPWKRGTFAALLAALHQAGARAIVVDLLFLEASEDAAEDEALGAMVRATGAVLARLPGRPPVIAPDAPSGLVDYPADADSTIRRYAYPDSLVAAAGAPVPPGTPLLRWYGGLGMVPARLKLGAWPLVAEGRSIQERLRASGVDEFDPTAVRTALAGFPKQRFQDAVKDKVVFVGVNHAAGFDVKAFPVGTVEPGVLCHWTAWGNAVQASWFREVPGFAPVLAFLILAGAFAVWWPAAEPLRLGLWALSAAALLGAASWLGFLLSIHLPVALPVLATLLGFTVLASRHWQSESVEKRRLGDLFGSYVSPAVLQRLLEHPDRLKLGGERRDVTVFFSDLAGFTDLSERVEPEVLVEVMNDYLSEMSGFILEENGYLNKYIGDAIMGVFGAPEPLQEHALAACRAAIRSRDRLAALAPRWEERYGVRLHARIGINSGPAVAGNIGSLRKREYTVLGDCVNLASRLEGANKPYGTTIMLGETTAALAGAAILTRPIDLLRVKGKQQPVLTRELLGLAEAAGPDERARAAAHESAFAHYRARRFTEALAAYAALQARDPGDTLACLYTARCRSFLDNPPPPDWDGVYQLKDK